MLDIPIGIEARNHLHAILSYIRCLELGREFNLQGNTSLLPIVIGSSIGIVVVVLVDSGNGRSGRKRRSRRWGVVVVGIIVGIIVGIAILFVGFSSSSSSGSILM